MRKLVLALATRLALLALVLLGLAPVAFAQSLGSSTTQTAQHLDAALNVSTSATSAATLTLTPLAGQSVYVYGLDITNCAGASAVTAAAVTSITTTNMNGLAYTLGSGTTAGACQPTITPAIPPAGVKAAAPGAVTFVLPTFATNQTVRLNIYWNSAP